MGIEFDCVKCGKEMFAQEQFAGRTVQCPECQTLLTVPVQSGVTPEAVQDSVPTQPPAPGTLRQLQQSGTAAVSDAAPGPVVAGADSTAASHMPPADAPPAGGLPPQGGAGLVSADAAPNALTPSAGLAATAGAAGMPGAGNVPGEMVRCQQCGQEIHKDAKMCRFCGKTQDPGLQRQVAARGRNDWPAWRGGRGYIEFGTTLEVSFEVVKKYWAKGAGFNFLFLFMICAAFGVLALVLMGTAAGMAAPGGRGGAGAGVAIAGLMMIFVMYLVAMLFLSILGAGWIYVGIKMVDNIMGRPVEPEISDLFIGFRRIGPILVSNILIFLVQFGAALLCGVLSIGLPVLGNIVSIVVSTWINLRFGLVAACIVDKNMGGVDAMRYSWSSTNGQVFKMFGLFLIVGLLFFISYFGLLIGSLVGLVLVQATWGSIYRQLTTL